MATHGVPEHPGVGNSGHTPVLLTMLRRLLNYPVTIGALVEVALLSAIPYLIIGAVVSTVYSGAAPSASRARARRVGGTNGVDSLVACAADLPFLHDLTRWCPHALLVVAGEKFIRVVVGVGVGGSPRCGGGIHWVSPLVSLVMPALFMQLVAAAVACAFEAANDGRACSTAASYASSLWTCSVGTRRRRWLGLRSRLVASGA